MLEINMDPFLIGGLSWHGIFTALGVAIGVFGAARLARDRGMDPQVVYSCAAWAIPGGVVGARLVHVFDNWSYYINDPVKIFTIWNGGVGLWGALLGGAITGVAWAILNKQSVGKLADISAPMMLVAQIVGRVGDVINGEHFSSRTSLPWGWVHTHANWPGLNTGRPAIPVSESGSDLAYHPSVAYEMVGDVLLFFVIMRLIGRVKPDGMVMLIYLGAYAVVRFAVQFTRDDPGRIGSLQQAHVIALLTMAAVLAIGVFMVIRQRTEGPRAPSPPLKSA